MASDSCGQIVLLPIRPPFARSIMKGEKKVEFRKVRFGNEVSHIVVYASRPLQKIVGYFEVSHIDEGPPEELWGRYNGMGGMTREQFDAYYATTTRGVVIGIGRVWPLREPVPLTTLGEWLTPPQSFTYITAEDLQTIENIFNSSSRHPCPR